MVPELGSINFVCQQNDEGGIFPVVDQWINTVQYLFGSIETGSAGDRVHDDEDVGPIEETFEVTFQLKPCEFEEPFY